MLEKLNLKLTFASLHTFRSMSVYEAARKWIKMCYVYVLLKQQRIISCCRKVSTRKHKYSRLNIDDIKYTYLGQRLSYRVTSASLWLESLSLLKFHICGNIKHQTVIFVLKASSTSNQKLVTTFTGSTTDTFHIACINLCAWRCRCVIRQYHKTI